MAVKMIEGRVACRISLAPESSHAQFYCDHCGLYFNNRHEPACYDPDDFEVVLPDVIPGSPLPEPEAEIVFKPKKKK